MNVLLIEDDEYKRSHIVRFIIETFPTADVRIEKSLQSGLRAIINGSNDLILLDMTMPTYDIDANESGGQPQAYAGREILRQMSRRKLFTPVIVITQFDKFGDGQAVLTLEELKDRLHVDHPQSFIGAVYYNVAEEGWKLALTDLIKASTVSGRA